MADVIVTASAVMAGANAQTAQGTAGATITAGQVLYKDTTDSDKLKLADADAVASANVCGIALHGASAGQPVTYITGGNLTMSGLTRGTVYAASTTAGGIAPVADLASGDFVTVLGIATSATNLKLALNVCGVAI